MATLSDYKGSVSLIAGITPKSSGYPLVEAHDVQVATGDVRLDTKLANIDTRLGTSDDAASATGNSVWSRVKKLQAEVGSNSDGDTLSGKVATNIGDISTLKTNLGTRPSGHADAFASIGTLEGNVSALQSSVGTSGDAANASGTTTWARIKAIENEIGGTGSGNSSISARISALQEFTGITGASSSTSLDSRLSTLQSTVSTATSNITTLQNGLGTSSDTGSATGTTAWSKANYAQAGVDSLKTKVGTKNDTASASADNVWARVLNAEADIDTLEAGLGKSNNAAQAPTDTNTTAWGRIKHAESEIGTLDTRADNHDVSIASLGNNLGSSTDAASTSSSATAWARIKALEATTVPNVGITIAANASDISDRTKTYLYTGTTTTSAPIRTNNHIYYYDGSDWADAGTIGGVSLDTTLQSTGAAAQAAAVGEKIDDIKANLVSISPTQPTSPTNRIWIDSTTPQTQVQIPTMTDFSSFQSDIAGDLSDINDDIDDFKQEVNENLTEMNTSITNTKTAVSELSSDIDNNIKSAIEEYKSIKAKTDIINDEALLYSENKLYYVKNVVDFIWSASNINAYDSTGPKAFKIPIKNAIAVDYPAFVSTGGYGSFICDSNNIVLWHYTETTGSEVVMRHINVPEGASYMILSVPKSFISTYDWAMTIYYPPLYDMYLNVEKNTEAIASVVNLLRNVNWVGNASINEDGSINSSSAGFQYSSLIQVDSSTCCLTYVSNGTNTNTRIHGYDSDGVWIKQIVLSASGQVTTPISVRFSCEGCKYIRISTRMRPNIELNTLQKIDVVIDVVTDVVSEALDPLDKQVKTYENYIIGGKTLLETLTWTNGVISADGTVTTNNNFHYTNLIPVENGVYTFVYVGAGVNNNTRIHAYDSNGDWVEQILLSSSGTITTPIVVKIPCDGYSYIRISTAKVTTVKALYSPVLLLPSENSGYPLGLHTMPESQGVINSIKRARQLTDIKWTPGAELARAFMDTGDTYLTSHGSVYRGKFDAGIEYKGLPYAEREYPYRWLGIEVPLTAFCSAIEKDNSVIALESPYTNYGAAYYGCVCTSLTCYAIDVPYTISYGYPNIPGLNFVGDINNGFDLSVLKLCDILYITGHCAIITDIYNNSNGTVAYIEVSEETRQGNSNRSHKNGRYGSVCRRITMDSNEFAQWFTGFKAYRYEHIDKVGYYPCPYVPMPDEGNRVCIHDYPLLPYMGNKTTYNTETAPTVKINFYTDEYTTLIVYKNGVEFGRYTITGETYHNVVCDTDEAKYTALLAVLENNEISYSTQSVEWYCRPHSAPAVSVSNSVATISITNSGEFKPYCFIVGDTFRMGGYTRIFEGDYTSSGTSGNITYTFTIPFAYSEPKVCKMFLRSEEWGVCEYNFTITP